MFAVNVEMYSTTVKVETNNNFYLFYLLLTLDQIVTTHDFTMKSDLEGLTASDQVDQKEQGACASKQTK